MPANALTAYDHSDALPGKGQEALLALLASDDPVRGLDDDALGLLGQRVVRETEIDDLSRSDWLDKMDLAINLAMQIADEKAYPWPKAANVKYPLMTVAAIQFNARAYPAIVPGSNIVKAKVVGSDKGVKEIGPDGRPAVQMDEQGQPQPVWKVQPGAKRKKGDRVATHMSWQLGEEMSEWDEDTDKLLIILPIVGMLLRKTWFDPTLGRNRSSIVHPKKAIVNYNAVSLELTPRITEEIEFYPYQIVEKRRLGIWRDVDLPLVIDEDEDAPHIFLEQHRRLDLDGDGYEEPWIVTVHKDSSMVVRIEPRFDENRIFTNAKNEIAKIEPVHHYTKYSFLPSIDGSFYDIGFGILLGPINETVNASINMMLNAGHLQTVGGGFINSGLKLRGGNLRFRPGEWKQVQMGAGVTNPIIPLVHPGPSAVLFELLGLLLEAGKDISAVQDVLTGEQGANETATTTLARIEQGLKVFTAIYKRVYRSMKSELGKLYDLNAKYLNPQTYFNVLDEEHQVGPEDYDRRNSDVVPVADPNSVSDMQKLARGEFLLGFRGDPLINQQEIRRRVFEAASVPDIDKLFEVPEPKPPPELIEIMAKVENDGQRLELEQHRLNLDTQKLEADLLEIYSKVIKNIADAEAAEAGPQLEQYKSDAMQLINLVKTHGALEQARLRGVANPSGNGDGAPVSQAPRGPAPAGLGNGPELDAGIGG